MSKIFKFKKLWKSIKLNKENKRDIKDLEYSNINLNDYILIDVRSRREFSEIHLNGAINLPLSEIKKNFGKYIKDKNKNIIVYCQSGVRSKKAVDIIESMGYTQVFNLKGGLENI